MHQNERLVAILVHVLEFLGVFGVLAQLFFIKRK